VTERLATIAASAALRRAPDERSERMDELVLGEPFEALEPAGDYLWGQARRDGYVGFARADALAAAHDPPTHWVRAIRTFAFADPSIKSAALGPYSLNALVRIVAENGDFARSDAGAWFWRGHLAAIGDFERDPATVAERFLGAPYLWGGRTSVGLDCSGLVQQSLYACGRGCPRDADQQAQLGYEVRQVELRRGDLVGWPGHIGMMLDATHLIHANGWHMAVAIEPLAEAVARIERSGVGAPTALRRRL
jgi:cell wall-associated NlpC family hydrolase